MTDTTPLTGEELAAIKARLHAATLSLARLNHVPNVNFARLNIAAALDDSEALVAEVERLRAILGEIAEPGYHAIWINDDGTIAQ